MKPIRYFQKGFNYSEDGPGNRLVYHLCGCNMHCPWCANPEGMDIHRTGTDIREISIDDLYREILSAEPMFFDDGGVTFTGGEATLQFDSLLSLCTELKKAGIGIALETNGTHPKLSELFPHLQLLIADLKHPDFGKLLEVTGCSGETILANLRKAVACGIPLLVRIPVVHGFNDSDSEIHGFAEILSSLAGIREDADLKVELLPYHEYGKAKWETLGLPYTVENGYVSRDRIRDFEKILCEHGLTIVHT